MESPRFDVPRHSEPSPSWKRDDKMQKKGYHRQLPADQMNETNSTLLVPTELIFNGTNPLNSTIGLPGMEGNSTSSLPNDPGYTQQDIQNWICAIFLVFVMCYCSRPQIPDARYRMAARRRAQLRRQHERLDRMKDPKIRERLIENALWIQKVIKKEEGQLTLGPLDAEINPTESFADEEEEESLDSLSEETSTCIICLEPFRVGDEVAWSKGIVPEPRPQSSSSSTVSLRPDNENNEEENNNDNSTSHNDDDDEEVGVESPSGPVATLDPDSGDHTESESQKCQHIFHKDCIHAWLNNPKHDDCPACRIKIIYESSDDEDQSQSQEAPTDDGDDGNSIRDIEEGAAEPADPGPNTVFVVVRGLVSQVQRAGFSLVGSDVEAGIPDEELFVIDDDDDDDVGMELVSTRREEDGNGHSSEPLQLNENPATVCTMASDAADDAGASRDVDSEISPAKGRERALSDATPCKCCHATSTPPRDKDASPRLPRVKSSDTMDTMPMSPHVSTPGALSSPEASPDSTGPVGKIFRNAREGRSKVPFVPGILSNSRSSRYAPLETSGSHEEEAAHNGELA